MNNTQKRAGMPHVGSEFQKYASQNVQSVCQNLKTSQENGLSSSQVKALQAQYGPNALTSHETTVWQILFNQVKSPLIYLLVIIAALNFMLGEVLDGGMIMSLVIINTLFSFYQEYRAHHALQLLKKYIIDTIRVLRDGKEIEIPANQLVPGDIIKVYPGDRIPADIRFTDVENITIDQAILTGESAPVQKNSDPIQQSEITPFNANNIGFSGTAVLSGKGIGIVFAIGNKTYFGSIATAAKEAPKLSSFIKGIARFSNLILYITLITVSCVFVLHLLFHAQHMDFITLVIFSMALGISIIPEALPIVITFGLSRGALQLAKHKVVVKRLSAIEDLGSMQILCTDKTGTITENKLLLADIKAHNEQEVILYGLLASGLPSSVLKKDQGFDGPLWQKLSEGDRALYDQYKVVAEHPFESQLRYSSVVVCKNDTCQLIMRGDITELIGRCPALSESQKKEISSWEHQQAVLGRRTLAITHKKVTKELTKITSDDEKDLEYIGLISYEDPIKPTAKAAVEHARKLGVAIKIISGDTKAVNFAVGKQIKLITNEDEIITGEEFLKKTDAERKKAIEHCSIFAHIVPEQKVQIIQFLENNYDVGYMGDGVNDAPALKIAHVSMAVDTATDVAKDVSDIILLHRSLRVIVNGIHEGRIIFANMIKYIKSTLAANFGHFYSLAIVSLFIDFLPMTPAQLLLVSLMTDFPLIAISTDTVSIQEIDKPKKYDLKDIVLVTTILGIIVMFADFIVFWLFYSAEPKILQTHWFVASILIELSFFYSIRTKLPFYKAAFPSIPVVILSSLVAITTLVLPFTAFGQKYLHFIPPSFNSLLIIGLLVICYFVVTDIVKVLFYKIYNKKTV